MLRTCVVGLAALAAAADGAQTSAPPIVGTHHPRADEPLPEDPQHWGEQVRLMLQSLCIVLHCQTGGASASDPELEAMVEAWITTYESGGVRAGMTPEELGHSLTVVGGLLASCENDPGVLPGELRGRFEETLVAIQADLLAGASR